MDLERIKQQFRIRSGRSKKLKKNRTGLVTSPTSQQEAKASYTNGAPTASQQTEAKSARQETQSKRPQQQPANEDPKKIEDQPASATEEKNEVEDQLAEATGAPEQSPEYSEPAPGGEEVNNNASDEAINGDEELTPKMDESHLSPSSDADDFDLNPPAPRSKPPSIETLAELLFSADHLNALVHHPPQLIKFSAFLQRYLPHVYPLLSQYLETQKAIKAVEYANAVAEGLKPKATGEDTSTDMRTFAARLDEEFEKISNASFDALVGDALPRFVSYTLVKIVSECLTNEITGRSTPVMRDLVGGLSEVFCLTDPNQEDNPIIYASEDFYRLTRYGPDDTLNNNCRFLQGRKTDRKSVERLRDAIKGGEEISEALLNYRRDGRPFINLLMIAPLHDKQGKLKYQIGAQVDVTGLVEGGRALEGFQRFLNRRADDKKREEAKAKRQGSDNDQQRKSRALSKLRDLSEMFDLEESAIVQAHSRSNSLDREDDDNRSIGSVDRSRRVYVDPDASDEDDDEEDGEQEQLAKSGENWTLGDAGDGRLSGKLPGVYDSFMLLRPAPSLRIVFVSPKLRRFGEVLQTPFLSHVAAPAATLAGLSESLQAGVPVTAKIHFASERGTNRNGTELKNGGKHEDGKHGRAIWISATPLLGADEQIGVWMCVVCEKSKVGNFRSSQSRSVQQKMESLNAVQDSPQSSTLNGQSPDTPTRNNNAEVEANQDRPIKPVRIDSNTVLRSPIPEKQQPEEVKEQKKDLRPMESVYFDTDERQSAPHQEIGKPERTEHESVEQDRDEELHSASDEDRAMTPVQEYKEESAESPDPKKRLVDDLDSLVESLPGDHDSADEYVATRSPQTQPSQNKDRVVIEEDSDVLAREESEDYHDLSESESPQTEKQMEYQEPKSVLSELDHEDEHENENKNDGVPSQPKAVESAPWESDQVAQYMDKWAHTTVTSSNLDDPFVDQTSVEGIDNSKEEPAKTQEVGSDEDQQVNNKAEVQIEETSNNTSKQFRLPADSNFPVAARASTPPDDTKHEDADHEEATSDQDQKVNNKDEVLDEESSNDTPKQFRLPSDSNFPVAARASTPPPDQGMSDAFAVGPEGKSPDSEEAESAEHKHDIENWVEDGRPASSSSNQQSMLSRGPSAAKRVGMDYLRAGSGRWTNTPALGPQRISEANKPPGDHRKMLKNADSDGMTNEDLCARSPYSVD